MIYKRICSGLTTFAILMDDVQKPNLKNNAFLLEGGLWETFSFVPKEKVSHIKIKPKMQFALAHVGMG